jgi:hypothetical protein
MRAVREIQPEYIHTSGNEITDAIGGGRRRTDGGDDFG